MNMFNIAARLAALSSAMLIAAPGYAEVATQSAHAATRPEACSVAKSAASLRALQDRGTVTGYSACECEDTGTNRANRWVCTVDAYYTVRKD